MKPHIVIGTKRWGVNEKHLSSNETANLLKIFLNENIVKFDLADYYGDYTTEKLFGEALKKSGIKRTEIKISTKCGLLYPGNKYKTKAYDTSRKHIIDSVNSSLQNLKVNYIDVLFLQRQDLLLNLEEVELAFTELKLSGKVKYFGVCDFSTFAYNILQKRIPLISNQIKFSLLKPQAIFDETLLQSGYHNKKTQIYSPLGNYFSQQHKNSKLSNLLISMANKYNANISQILLAWTLKVPYKITPILGSTDINRIKEQIKAFDINLEQQDWYELLEASRAQSII